ncbi:hypothetical protein EJ05DRAFT_23657 [Pseudovirgaria hyperparasitica]|uniref:Galactose oxidase n=1 Tax=Pseudovirgaria hyperparasitica TaxID=470096 RepID=A0A6A6WLD6_9PEZI|nr:uncharacterized protein EJ05DRAFT_23657 [Pseudovirgaria hyperparasitica]KAF2763024.1 hypothetical protein EJ05DRAFT_23657 [Pseudovirgaria hyperparasitica]
MPVLNDVASSLNGARDESDQNQNQPETSNSDPCAQVEVKAALIGDNIIFATLPVEGSGEAAGEPGLHSVSASLPELSIESTENIPNSNFDAKLDGFWYDRTSVYAFGQSGNVIEYDTSKDNGWQTVQLDQVDIPTGSMTSDPSYGRSIAAKLDAGSTTITVFDTSANEPKIRTLNPPPSGPNQLAREDEAVFFLPIGKSGALVVLGGQHWEPGSTGPVDLPLTDIDFLDIEAGKWTKVVLTTPDASKVPGARSKFCGWVVPSQDGKSFSIVIHGGRTADATGQPIIYGDVCKSFYFRKQVSVPEPDRESERSGVHLDQDTPQQCSRRQCAW